MSYPVILFAYIIVGLVFGYIIAHQTYHEGAYTFGGRPGTIAPALWAWFVCASLWPIMLFLCLLAVVLNWWDNQKAKGDGNVAHKIGKVLFPKR